MDDERPEISDLIVDFDPKTLARKPVEKAEVLDTLCRLGMRRAAKIVEKLPERNGILDAQAVDETLLRAHAELQRLSEEFQQGHRMLKLLRPCVASLFKMGVSRPVQIIDVGCGLGFVIRWLCAHGGFGDEVEWVGCDYNRTLIQQAARLAREEELGCRFLTKNAFALEEPGSIFISTGVLHHFRGPSLTEFFVNQSRPSTRAFFHFDVMPSWVSPLGAWVFHISRMREPLARYDGVRSAIRAHSNDVLAKHVKEGAPDFLVSFTKVEHLGHILIRALRPIIGLRPELEASFTEQLGPAARTLEAFR